MYPMCIKVDAVVLRCVGTTPGDVDYAVHEYHTVGTYTMTVMASNSAGNTTVRYVVVVQWAVTSNYTLNSTAPSLLPPGEEHL